MLLIYRKQNGAKITVGPFGVINRELTTSVSILWRYFTSDLICWMPSFSVSDYQQDFLSDHVFEKIQEMISIFGYLKKIKQLFY